MTPGGAAERRHQGAGVCPACFLLPHKCSCLFIDISPSISGFQVVLRKGGIREPAFTLPASRFLLFPTSFHSGAGLVKPDAAARFAQVRRAGNPSEFYLALS